ncbi:YhcH/YjgK/YiaL family protein [bacterium]|nr:YhcH/YjgK/YiaL family protein [bacterium]
MIKDKIINAKKYYGISENIKRGLQWLENQDLNNLSNGKYEIDGDKIFSTVQTYETKTEAMYEAHRNYIDIQYVVSGVEKIGVTDISNCNTSIEYSKEKDIEFFNNLGNEDFFTLPKDYFLILYPNEAHKPSITNDNKSIVKKVVVKVAI